MDDANTPSEPQELQGELLITGITQDGRVFRPSDWAERLCGVMACFRPQGEVAMYAHLGYSPYVKPTLMNDVRGVLVHYRLKEIEPRAWDFVVSFARDNDLVTHEICSLDEHPDSSTG